MIDLLFKIQGMKPAFIFNNGYGEDIYAYLIHECECCMNKAHEFIIVYEALALPEDEPWSENYIQMKKVTVDERCRIRDHWVDSTWKHNFWVKCSEYFAEKILLEEE
jgi:hypothetical protein